MQLLQNHTNI